MTPSMNPESIAQFVGHVDAAAFKLINSGMASKALDAPMLVATALGAGAFQTGVSLALIAVGLIKERLNLRLAGYAGLAAFAVSGILVQVGKLTWHRPRPLLSLFDVRVVGDPLFTQSFPSGHTMTAFAVTFAWAACLPRLRWPLIALAFATGLSRVYLGVHYPLDVAYGAALGALTGALAARPFRARLQANEQA